MTDPWFVDLRAGSGPAPLLICLPPAGSGPGSFRGWAAALPPGPAVTVLALPGREARIAESPRFTLDELVEAVRSRVEGPFALYGHSMGGVLAFEVTRALRERGDRLPGTVFLGGARPPQAPKGLAAIADLPDRQFLARIAALGGLPPGLLALPELVDLVLPALRSDFRWLNAHVHEDQEPLPVPLVCLAGDADPEAGPELMAGWAEHTTAGCTVHTVRGGHLFFTDHAAEAAAVVGKHLLG